MLKLTRRKRPKKEGSRRDIYYLTGAFEGHEYRESLKTDRKEEAQRAFERKRAEIIAAHKAGRERDVTFADAAADYLEDEKDGRFLRPILLAWGDMRLEDITPGDVRSLSIKLYPKGKPATRNRQAIVPISAVINHAAEKRWCGHIRVKRFPEGKTEKTAVDRQWVDAFMRAANELGRGELGVMELFMFTTGARLNEAEDLTKIRLRLDDRTAIIPATKNDDDQVKLLTDEMVRAARTLRLEDLGAHEPVFGYPRRRQLYHAWKAICERAGIEYIPPHQSGRHSFATEMVVRNKVDPATTAKIGGWRSTRMLVEKYSHPEFMREVADEVFAHKTKPDLRAVPRSAPKRAPKRNTK